VFFLRMWTLGASRRVALTCFFSRAWRSLRGLPLHVKSIDQGTKNPPKRSYPLSTYESLDTWRASEYCRRTDKAVHTDPPDSTKEAVPLGPICTEHSVYMHYIMDLERPLAYRNQRAYTCLT
jgi:hypothetical protein